MASAVIYAHTLETLDPVHVVLVENDVVISYGAIVRKKLEHAGQTFDSCGLHGVFTFPDFRNEGHGAQVVAAATRYVHEHSNADIAVLFCPPELVPFYGAAGWEHRADAITLVGPADTPSRAEEDAEKPDMRMMLFLSEKGKQARACFWDRPVYFGESGW